MKAAISQLAAYIDYGAVVERVMKWLFGRVATGFLVVAVAATMLWLKGQNYSMDVLIGAGQLLPLSASIAGGAMVDCFAAKHAPVPARMLVGLVSALLWMYMGMILTEVHQSAGLPHDPKAHILLPSRVIGFTANALGLSILAGLCAITMDCKRA